MSVSFTAKVSLGILATIGSFIFLEIISYKALPSIYPPIEDTLNVDNSRKAYPYIMFSGTKGHPDNYFNELGYRGQIPDKQKK